MITNDTPQVHPDSINNQSFYRTVFLESRSHRCWVNPHHKSPPEGLPAVGPPHAYADLAQLSLSSAEALNGR